MLAARNALRRFFGSTATGPLFRPLLRDRAAVFMLHRFAMPDAGVEGHDPHALRRTLEVLRRERIDLISLGELVAQFDSGVPLSRPTVAFTIDDGYVDHAAVAAPAFAAFDVPVTTFATTGFLDRELWFWWDRIEYIIDSTTRKSVSVQLGDAIRHYAWSDERERRQAQADFTARCKQVSDVEKLAAIERLAAAAEVSVPAVAPARYAPMTWSELRQCETRGMTFGPHTVTHPILARTSDAQCTYELTESWNRLRAEAQNPVPVFCYPNGQLSDFGDREVRLLGQLGLRAAVTGDIGYAEGGAFRRTARDPFVVRRFAYAETLPDMLAIVNGAERLKQIARGQR